MKFITVCRALALTLVLALPFSEPVLADGPILLTVTGAIEKPNRGGFDEARDKFFGFNDLFELVYDRLKERNAVSGGEEMLRLRAYEKLQNLVTRGLVEKNGKEYKGLDRIEEAHSDNIAAQQA